MDMTPYVMRFDELGHCAGNLEGSKAVIARLLWHDNTGYFRLLKLQNAVDASFKDRRFGRMIINLFSGNPVDYSSFAFPEPTGLHFGELTYSGPASVGCMPDFICAYCGLTFDCLGDKRSHLKHVLGDHYYDGHLAVVNAITALGKSASTEDIFRRAKDNLFMKYPKYSPFLHTHRCKTILLRFIEKMKSY